MRQKFTIDDIDEYLEELTLKWIDKIVYNSQTDKYERAKLKHFKQPLTCLFIQSDNGNRALALAQISNDEFVVKFENAKINVSEGWLAKLEAKTSKNQVLNEN